MNSSIVTPKSPPSLAVLDGDILLYRAAFYCDSMGVDELEGRIKEDLELWTPACCKDRVVALSSDRSTIFRRRLWPTYKEHRNTVQKPDCLGYAYEIIMSLCDCKRLPELEADDLMGILTSMGKAVCVTIDKDLLQIPGWHLNPDKMMEEPILIDEIEASRWFHTQWLSGDSTDNYPGLPGIGPAKAEKLVLSQLDPKYWTLGVMALFEQKGFSLEYALAQRACAKILDCTDWDASTKMPRVYEW